MIVNPNQHGLHVRSLLAGLIACAVVMSSAWAQEYPTRPVRIISPFPPGSITDLVARPMGQKLSEMWKQPVVIENRAGAGGIVGAQAVATAAPDGYTMLTGSQGINATNATLYAQLPYDAVKGFAAITQVATSNLLLVVPAAFEAKSVRELVALAKAKPGSLNFGSGGPGTSTHLAGELFNALAGVKIVHVPYKGSPQSMTDLLAGQITLIFANAAIALPHVQSGRLRLLAVASAQRDPTLPDVPTVAEMGYPDFAADAWVGLFAPAGTPAPVVEKIAQSARTVLANAELVRGLASQQLIVKTSPSPAAFSAYVSSEIVKWGNVVRMSGAKAD